MYYRELDALDLTTAGRHVHHALVLEVDAVETEAIGGNDPMVLEAQRCHKPKAQLVRPEVPWLDKPGP